MLPNFHNVRKKNDLCFISRLCGVVSGRVSLESQDTVVPGLVAADTDELI
jgi:hypothetical protein